MPITQDGGGQIVYTKPEKGRQFEETGTVLDTDFAIADKNNVLKQVKFDINPTSGGAGTLTLQANISGDSTIVLSSLASTAFSTIQPDSGTSPVADSASATLTLTSSDSSVSITGNSATDTVDFKVGQLVDSRNWFIETPYDRTYTLDQYAKYGYTVEDVTIITSSGTCSIAFKIDGTDITGLSAVSASSVESTSTATAAKTVAVGNTLTAVVSSSAAPDSLAIALKIKRT